MNDWHVATWALNTLFANLLEIVFFFWHINVGRFPMFSKYGTIGITSIFFASWSNFYVFSWRRFRVLPHLSLLSNVPEFLNISIIQRATDTDLYTILLWIGPLINFPFAWWDIVMCFFRDCFLWYFRHSFLNWAENFTCE